MPKVQLTPAMRAAVLAVFGIAVSAQTYTGTYKSTQWNRSFPDDPAFKSISGPDISFPIDVELASYASRSPTATGTVKITYPRSGEFTAPDGSTASGRLNSDTTVAISIEVTFRNLSRYNTQPKVGVHLDTARGLCIVATPDFEITQSDMTLSANGRCEKAAAYRMENGAIARFVATIQVWRFFDYPAYPSNTGTFIYWLGSDYTLEECSTESAIASANSGRTNSKTPQASGCVVPAPDYTGASMLHDVEMEFNACGVPTTVRDRQFYTSSSLSIPLPSTLACRGSVVNGSIAFEYNPAKYNAKYSAVQYGLDPLAFLFRPDEVRPKFNLWLTGNLNRGEAKQQDFSLEFLFLGAPFPDSNACQMGVDDNVKPGEKRVIDMLAAHPDTPFSIPGSCSLGRFDVVSDVAGQTLVKTQWQLTVSTMRAIEPKAYGQLVLKVTSYYRFTRDMRTSSDELLIRNPQPAPGTSFKAPSEQDFSAEVCATMGSRKNAVLTLGALDQKGRLLPGTYEAVEIKKSTELTCVQLKAHVTVLPNVEQMTLRAFLQEYVATAGPPFKQSDVRYQYPVTTDPLIVHLSSLELVQTVQDSVSNDADSGSVPMIAGKPTVLRAFVETGSAGMALLPRESGSLNAELTYNDDTKAKPMNAGTVFVAPNPDRNEINHSFNFRIDPKWTTAGNRRFWVALKPAPSIQIPDGADRLMIRRNFTKPENWPNPFTVMSLRVCFEGANLETCKQKAPSVMALNAVGVETTIRKLFPISADGLWHIVDPHVIVLKSGNRSRSRRLSAISLMLQQQGTADQFIFWSDGYGAVPDFFASGSGLGTHSIASVDASADEVVSTIAANLGLKYGALEERYPKETEAAGDGTICNGSTQGVGFDVEDGRIVRSNTFDLMFGFYRENIWISPVNFKRLANTAHFQKLNRTSRARKQVQETPSQAGGYDVFVITGSVTRDGTGSQLDPGYRITAVTGPPETSTDGEYCIELRGAAGVLGRHYFNAPMLDSETGRESDAASFAIAMPFPAGVTKVVLLRGTQELAALTGNGIAPAVSVTSPQAGDRWDGGQRTIRWLTSDRSGQEVKHTVLYSPNNGGYWLPLDTDVTGNEIVVNTSDLIGGDQVLFRVLATNGIDSGTATVGPIKVVQQPKLVLDSTSVEFGSAVPGAAVERTLTLSNPGTGPLAITSATIDNPAFQIINLNLPSLVPASAKVEVRLRFVPVDEGARTGSLIFESNDASGSKISVVLSGNGVIGMPAVGPRMELTTASINFGSTTIGMTALSGLTLRNTGDSILSARLSISSPAFTFTSPVNLQLPPGVSKRLTVQFTPTTAGVQSGSLTIVTNEAARSEVTLQITGTGVVSSVTAPRAEVTPASLDFGTIAAGQTKSLTLAIRNSGTAVLQVSGTSIQPASFSVSTTSAFQLNPGGSSAISVRFAPVSAGSFAGTLTFTTNDPASPTVRITLTGIGISATSPKAEVTPGSLDFTSVTIGQTKDLTLTLRNTGTAVLQVSRLTVDGSFTVTPATAFPVAAAASAALTVRFAPASIGATTGALTLTTNDSAQPVIVIPLRGTGVSSSAPSIDVSSTSLDFGTVQIGATKDMPLTIYNRGTATLLVSSLASNNGQFTAMPSSSTVAFGGSVSVTVRFVPSNAGAYTASLTVTSNDPARPSLSISLRGTAVATSSSEVLLKVDGGSFDGAIGFPTGAETAVFVNRLTPASYPATLKSIDIYFGDRSNGLPKSTPITIVAATNPSGSSAISLLSVGEVRLGDATIVGTGAFNRYLVPDLTITTGDFIVGFLVYNPPNVYPADVDRKSGTKQRSYLSSDGMQFRLLDAFGADLAGNFGIRANVVVPR